MICSLREYEMQQRLLAADFVNGGEAKDASSLVVAAFRAGTRSARKWWAPEYRVWIPVRRNNNDDDTGTGTAGTGR